MTSHLPIALSKILSHSKTIKNTKKLLVFGKNNSCCLSKFLQTHIFWNFNHISRIYNQINYRDIWFAKEMIILTMTVQVPFYDVFLKRACTLMSLRIMRGCNIILLLSGMNKSNQHFIKVYWYYGHSFQ